MSTSFRGVAAAAACATLFSAGAASADICLTFGSSTDLFRGRLIPLGEGLRSLVFVEETFDRAAYGAAVPGDGKLNIALTKPTTTATVSDTCQIDVVQGSGPCQIQVVTADPLEGTRLDDVGFLDTNCTAALRPTRGGALPAGE
jgi:hypothetical protein